MSLNITPDELKVVSAAAGDVKEVLDALKAAGITGPALDVADAVAADVQLSLANGTFDVTALIPALKAEVSSPLAKAILARLKALLGKLFAPAAGA